jgi:hypothetical protein
MELFRYLTLLISLVCLGFVAVQLWKELPSPDYEWVWLIPVSLVLNIVYVWLSRRPPDRIGRLISLWLDAKEAELRSRAKGKD